MCRKLEDEVLVQYGSNMCGSQKGLQKGHKTTLDKIDRPDRERDWERKFWTGENRKEILFKLKYRIKNA